MSNYSFENLRILIVDDNKHMRSLLSAILGAFGCKDIVQATDTDRAWTLLGEYKPDIVIADLVMRPTDGVSFIRRVRNSSDSPNPFQPIIMITGHASSSRVNQARDAGVNEFLVKPVSANGLLKRMDAIICQPRPFIRAKTYFGPDRRRHVSEKFKGQERRDAGVFEIDDSICQPA